MVKTKHVNYFRSGELGEFTFSPDEMPFQLIFWRQKYNVGISTSHIQKNNSGNSAFEVLHAN